MNPEHVARLEVEKAAFDAWVASLGGFASTRFIALCREAREMAGPGGQWRYLDLARAAEEEQAMEELAREATDEQGGGEA